MLKFPEWLTKFSFGRKNRNLGCESAERQATHLRITLCIVINIKNKCHKCKKNQRKFRLKIGLKLICSCYPSAAALLKIKILFKWGVRDDDAVRTKVWIPILFFNQPFKASFEQYLVKNCFPPIVYFCFQK